MKKIISILVLALALVPAYASDNISAFYTDFGSDGIAIDTLATKSVFFQVENPLKDSIITYYDQYASTGSPAVSCTLWSTVDDITPVGGKTINDLASKAKWTAVVEVFSALSTESTVLYYGVTQANLAAKFGRFFKLSYTAASSGTHNVTSKILKAGIINLRMPD